MRSAAAALWSLTGTPISEHDGRNIPLQRYFSYDQLVEMGLSHFDSWAQMFADDDT